MAVNQGSQQKQPHYDVYEVFIQRDFLGYHTHIGSVVAASPELAQLVARENFLRRDAAISIWVVHQTDIHETSYEDTDFFINRATDKSYRDVSGYVDNAKKWKAFKERAITIEDLVHDAKR
ncbi:phenylacetic acid degradation protein [Alicyclobacillaceae bacterium I2511]|nr:phenylacetic acid degradation protein [Alicyclobacillaceae bacterium I2511]